MTIQALTAVLRFLAVIVRFGTVIAGLFRVIVRLLTVMVTRICFWGRRRQVALLAWSHGTEGRRMFHVEQFAANGKGLARAGGRLLI
jgi:hypothetical protein